MASVASLTPSRAQAAPLAEAEVVKRVGAAQAPLVQAWAAVGRAAVAATAVWPNPSLGVSHEQVFGSGAASDSYLTLSVPLAVGGRRRRRQARAAHDRAIRAARSHAETVTAQLGGRRLFVELCALHKEHVALQALLARLARLTRVTQARLARGDASQITASRLELALGSRRLRAAQLKLRLRATAGRLRAAMGARTAEAITPSRTCLDAQPLPSLGTLLTRVEQHPLLATLRAQRRRAARLATHRLADVLPQLGLLGGYRGSQGAGATGHGFIVGLQLPLPLFDRLQGKRGQAAARHRLYELQHGLLRRRLRTQVDSLHTALAQTRMQRALLARQRKTSDTVLDATEALFAAGEGNVFRLIDAYRGWWEARRAIIDAAADVRRLWIELARLIGEPALGLGVDTR